MYAVRHLPKRHYASHTLYVLPEDGLFRSETCRQQISLKDNKQTLVLIGDIFLKLYYRIFPFWNYLGWGDTERSFIEVPIQ